MQARSRLLLVGNVSDAHSSLPPPPHPSRVGMRGTEEVKVGGQEEREGEADRKTLEQRPTEEQRGRKVTKEMKTES